MVAAPSTRPPGVRSFGGGRHALSFRTDPLTYFRRANDEVLIVAQIDVRMVLGREAGSTAPGSGASRRGRHALSRRPDPLPTSAHTHPRPKDHEDDSS